jgi:hypothetical protein
VLCFLSPILAPLIAKQPVKVAVVALFSSVICLHENTQSSLCQLKFFLALITTQSHNIVAGKSFSAALTMKGSLFVHLATFVNDLQQHGLFRQLFTTKIQHNSCNESHDFSHVLRFLEAPYEDRVSLALAPTLLPCYHLLEHGKCKGHIKSQHHSEQLHELWRPRSLHRLVAFRFNWFSTSAT